MRVFSRSWTNPDTRQADPALLQSNGPVLPVEIHLDSATASFLAEQNQPLPRPVTGLGLIDTGAAVTCADAGALAQLDIPPLGTVLLHTPGGPVTQEIFPCQIRFPGTPIHPLDFSAVPGSNLAPQGIVALIGRDLLRHFQLVYNGVEGFWTLSL